MVNSVYMLDNYGVIKKGFSYPVLKEGRDYYQIKCHGKPIYVPKCMTSNSATKIKNKEESREESEEELYSYTLE